MNKILFYLLIPIFTTLSNNAYADNLTNETKSFATGLGHYLSVPSRWTSSDWAQFGIITGGLYILSESLDDHWKDEMVNEDHPSYYKGIDKIGDAWGDGRLSAPFVLGLYGYGQWTNDQRYIHATHNILQTAIYTSVMTQIIKHTFRRDRPNAASDESGWFENGVSFPSGHTSNAFAISQSFLNSLEKPSLGIRILFYGLATSTAFARTYDNAHWASDTIAGALLGIYTANYVAEHPLDHSNSYSITPFIDNNQLGINLRW